MPSNNSLTKFSAFGLADVEIAKYSDTAGISGAWKDVPGVTQANCKMSVSTVDQMGDDQRIHVWFHSQKGTVSIRATQASLIVLEMMSGNDVSSSPTGFENLLFGTNKELEPPEIVLRAKARTKDNPRDWATVYFFRGVVHTAFEDVINFQLGKELEVTWNVELLPSTRDEKGQSLSAVWGVDYAMGRLEV